MTARILHILGTAKQEGSAIAGLVKLLATRMDRKEFELHACFLGDGKYWADKLRALDVRVVQIHWPIPTDLIGAFRFYGFLRKNHFDLAHIHYGGRSVRRLIRYATEAAIVVHLHGRVREDGDYQPKQNSFRDINGLIATSHAVSAYAVASPKWVVHPAIEPPLHADAPNNNGVVVIGTAGRLVDIKGFRFLLAAFSNLSREFPWLRLEIAGDGPERGMLEKQTAALGLNDKVRFLGWCDDLDTIISRWQLFVQPSLEEAFGITILQAMNAGLPVVATRVGGIPEVVIDGETGALVPPSNPDELASAVAALIRDPERRARLAAAARTRAALFSPECFLRQVSDVYRAVLANKS